MKLMLAPSDGLIEVKEGQFTVIYEKDEKTSTLDYLTWVIENYTHLTQKERDTIKDLFDEVAIADYPDRYIN